MKILLVEDDIEISDMLKNFLSTENFEVTASYNGKDACQKFFMYRHMPGVYQY